MDTIANHNGVSTDNALVHFQAAFPDLHLFQAENGIPQLYNRMLTSSLYFYVFYPENCPAGTEVPERECLAAGNGLDLDGVQVQYYLRHDEEICGCIYDRSKADFVGTGKTGFGRAPSCSNTASSIKVNTKARICKIK
ncbi:hypothetical protein THAOC_27245, partial [Thalassiosira oceanica]